MMEETWRAVLDYIDTHIEENLTVAQIASIAGYSAFHFNRIFAAHMDIPVMQYMRMRKLQHSAALLSDGQRVLDVALQYGFSSHEGFTRAFKRHFGIAPQNFRLLFAGNYQTPPRPTGHGEPKGVSSMQPKKIVLQDRVLVGYRIHTQPGSADIPAFWNALMSDVRWADLCDRAAPGAWNYGLCDHPASMPEGRMDYLIAFDYDGTSPLSEGMELYTLKAATYMAFTACDYANDDMSPQIKRCWTQIYSEWFPASGVMYDGNKPDFELYNQQGAVEIWIPIIEG